MNLLKHTYHFLGGVYFAMILIASVTLFVIAGTFLESSSQSHLYAAAYTYDSPLFALLLWGFFINILFAATRRWPFRWKHAPFLITHLGLLMVLGGVLLKHYFGHQGTMLLTEGSGSHVIRLANTFAINVQKRGEKVSTSHPLKRNFSGRYDPLIARRDDGLVLQLAEITPHVSEHLATWAKGPVAVIDGLRPMPMVDVIDQEELTLAGRARFGSEDAPVWDLFALRTDHTEAVQKQVKKLARKTPALAIIENSDHDVSLFAVGPYGDVWTQHIGKGGPESLIAYDDGFSGYAVKAELPFDTTPAHRASREQVIANKIKSQLEKARDEGVALATPLEIFKRACEKAQVDFPDMLTTYLVRWNATGSWLYPESTPLPAELHTVFANMTWEDIDPHVATGCQWALVLFDKVGEALESDDAPLEVLRKARWPLLASLERENSMIDPEGKNPSVILELLTQQMLASAAMLPAQDSRLAPPQQHAAMLSVLMRAYGIHMSTIANDDSAPSDPLVLETRVMPVHEVLSPSNKIEDNKPRVVLHAAKDTVGKAMALAYDRSGTGLKWPVLHGEYLLRFQPDVIDIPYHVRLRQARQINYANSNQAYSYESDLVVTEMKSGMTRETTISMNNVYETWDGYRFYLSSISPSDESTAKKIVVVVNRDPAKYWLTYPGAVVLTCGIVWLFCRRKKNDDE